MSKKEKETETELSKTIYLGGRNDRKIEKTREKGREKDKMNKNEREELTEAA